MYVFKKFLEKHDNAYLYLHTNMHSEFPRGYNLIKWADMLGVLDHVRYPDFNPILEPKEDEEMAVMYSASDIYCTMSVAEGFGIPLVEAQACEVPCIVPNNTSQTELVTGHGWVVENIPRDYWIEVPVYVPSLYTYEVPNMKKYLEALEEAYHRDDLRKAYGKMSREFMVKYYDWSKILPMWDKFLEEVESELDFFKKIREGLS
jgi:glycosyltransferase involved in cell wall biosynthesis